MEFLRDLEIRVIVDFRRVIWQFYFGETVSWK